MKISLHTLAAVTLTLAGASQAGAQTCEGLATTTLAGATITTAQSVAAGAFAPPAAPGGRGGGPNFADLPGFCRVAATLKPTAESEIRIEVWMPERSGWS